MGDPSLAPGGPLFSSSSHGSMMPSARSPDSSPGKSGSSPQSGAMGSPISHGTSNMNAAPGSKMERGQQQGQMQPIGTLRYPPSPMKGNGDGQNAGSGMSPPSSGSQVSTNGLVREWKKEVRVTVECLENGVSNAPNLFPGRGSWTSSVIGSRNGIFDLFHERRCCRPSVQHACVSSWFWCSAATQWYESP